ncbi:portal vertex of the head [Synechococcus phage S-CAM3]|uniref:Portal protein n=2 Tax=Viruses TaxID=10239 RepID=A0A1D8KJ17_9CAUD|nr:portal vertex of the head [Synechococcus phage S-CAM3]AOV58882.1 portal vertex of the head [Synechococcus phage S-CAM3]
MSQLFGFLINKGKEDRGQSPIPPNSDDSVATVAGGYFGTYVDVEGVSKNEYELIKRYRDMSLHPEVDTAIDEIVNEFVVSDANDSPVEIELSNLDIGAGVKKKIRDEFDRVKKMINFDKNAHQIIRNWYVDGRTYYHKVVDLDNPKKGILELRYVDPLKIRKVRQKISNPTAAANPNLVRGTALEYDWGDYVDYYLYNPKGFSGSMSLPHNSASDFSTNNGIKIASDSIATCNSGVMDLNKKYQLSFLHKAIKSLNQLRMIEDSLVIYRLSRAPERRIFYIDVGNLPKVKAEQYLRDVMARYRNKLVYDASTGEIRDDKKHMSMLEDFWLPRREGGRGTEISTLPGGQNLGELKDVEYFKKKLYNSLNLPPSRLTDDNKAFNLGKSTEILRDELKFAKFIGRLRKRFSNLFHDILKTQLILKGIITPDDWDEMEEHIQYDFLFDNHFNELKEQEMMMQRITLVTQMDPFVGKYFSSEYIRRQVLMQTEKEYKEITKQMSADIDSGMAIDPVDVNTLDMMDKQNSAYQPEITAQQASDSADRELEKAKEMEKLKPAPAAAKPKSNK